jgi:hypothetical protein
LCVQSFLYIRQNNNYLLLSIFSCIGLPRYTQRGERGDVLEKLVTKM